METPVCSSSERTIPGWCMAHGAVGVLRILHWQRLEKAAAERQLGEADRACRAKTWF